MKRRAVAQRRWHEPKNQSAADLAQFEAMEKEFLAASGGLAQKIDTFPRFVTRQAIAKFLARYEIFKKILIIGGSIVECGVLDGAGLFTFAKLSSIFEPVNHPRRVIGFDTFAGVRGITARDRRGTSSHARRGGLRGATLRELERSVALYDLNRPLSHIPKIELVKGDLSKTAPAYVRDHPHLVVALLYLDVDIFLPTRDALKAFRPRMPRGAVVVFDELNARDFPGETEAVHQVLGLHKVRIRRFPFDSYLSYAVLD